MRWLVEEVHPEAEKIVLVMDNLNTHRLASLDEAFPPERARRIADRLEIHHTPKHGSWLNMPEIELSVLSHHRRHSMATTISPQTKRDLLPALRDRYQKASRIDRARILDEYVALAKCHRKHATSKPCSDAPSRPP